MNIKNWFGKIPKKVWVGTALAILITASAVVYSVFASQTETTSEEDTLQTSVVRRGDLTISASGTGVLSASDEVELSFTVSGDVLGVYFKAGDKVEAGDLLTELASSEAETEYANAKRTYMELTSPAAIASSLDELAQAQKSYTDAVYQLEYLISPDVMYWEQKIAETEKKLEIAKSQLNANPADNQAKKQAEETESYLAYAKMMMKDAQNLYYNEYAFENFVKRNSEGHRYLALPTETDIYQARLAVDDANATLAEAKLVYEALSSGVIPENTGLPSLLEIQEAQRDLETAQTKLDGTKIIAPINGTIMSVDITPGDQADTGTVITLADLSQPNLDIYMDESDWDKTVAGNKTEIVFDALPDLVFTGKIETVDNELYTSGASTAVHGTVVMDSSFNDINLPIGAAASVEVMSASVENSLLVPIDALQITDSGEYTVFVVTAEGLQSRVIKIGIQNELYAEVKSGLNEGETVATGVIQAE